MNQSWFSIPNSLLPYETLLCFVQFLHISIQFHDGQLITPQPDNAHVNIRFLLNNWCIVSYWGSSTLLVHICFGISILWWVLYKLELVLARALKVSNDKIYTYFIIFKTYASHCYRELQSKPKNYLVPRKRKKYLALLEVYCRSTLQVNFEGKETWITKLCIINITCN